MKFFDRASVTYSSGLHLSLGRPYCASKEALEIDGERERYISYIRIFPFFSNSFGAEEVYGLIAYSMSSLRAKSEEDVERSKTVFPGCLVFP